MPTVKKQSRHGTAKLTLLRSESSANFCIDYISSLRAGLERMKDNDAAKDMKRWVLSTLPPPTRNQLTETLATLWSKEQREYQYCGVDLAIKYHKILRENGNDQLLTSIRFIGNTMIQQKSWWDTVDMIASNVIGPLVKERKDLLIPEMEKWNCHSTSLWMRRTSLIFQLRYGLKTDVDLLFRMCYTLWHEKDLFIEKAIGWSLRQASRSFPSKIRKFCDENKKDLAKLSYKEATKYC